VTLASSALVLAPAVVAANTGRLPGWGNDSTDGMTAGPLGLNTAGFEAQLPVAMVIPDAGVDASVETRSLVNGVMQDPTGPWVVSWYDFSSFVGGPGNAVFAGHVDYWGVGPSVFQALADVGTGATISVIGQDGTEFVYEVIDSYRVDAYALTEAQFQEITGPHEEAVLTIITCGGAFNGSEYLQRDIVRARLAGSRVATDENGGDDDEDEEPAEADTGDGTTATIDTDGVNIRQEPTTAAEVIAIGTIGTDVTITGDAVEADGYTWYPILLPDGTEGWIASDFLAI
jgi:hypothetical protein